MYKLLMAAAAAGSLLSCNNAGNPVTANAKDTDNTANRTLDTTVASPLGLHVEGTAGKLYVDDGGAGGLPVVFVHSFGGSTVHWKDQLAHLRTNRRAIAIDLRGHGKSEAPANNDYSVTSLAGDIAAVADQLKLDRFILVGHSMGGSAAVAYTGVHPEHVAGLLLVGTPGKSSPEQSTPIINSLKSDAYEKVMTDYTNRLLINATPVTDSLVRQGEQQLPKQASINMISAVFQFDPLPPLQHYKGPAMIVYTDSEDKIPNALHHQLKNIPGKMVKGTSHWIQLDKPDVFNNILDDFLKKADK